MTYVVFNSLISYVVFVFVSLYLLWIFYLAVMNLKQAKGSNKLSKIALYFGTPVLIIGLVIDLVCNILISLPFLDSPRETTVTARLKRYAAGKDDWRKKFTLWFADDMLDDFDPSGKHI